MGYRSKRFASISPYARKINLGIQNEKRATENSPQHPGEKPVRPDGGVESAGTAAGEGEKLGKRETHFMIE